MPAIATRFRTDARNRQDTASAIVQAEDELASIGMVIGAAWNGARAFTTTSGPGISLMQEFLGLAYFAEIPAVIFDVQRAGPSTGMPTRTQQCDLMACAYASHGDTKHVLLFPQDPHECFVFGAQACRPAIIRSSTAPARSCKAPSTIFTITKRCSACATRSAPTACRTRPPPPPPIPPTRRRRCPPPPAPTWCFSTGTRADLSARARQIVSQAAAASTHVQTTRIEVNGYTDLSGTKAYNDRLSRRRAEAVQMELVRDGVSEDEIVMHGFGESNPLVPTAPGVREPQNRRVEILLR